MVDEQQVEPQLLHTLREPVRAGDVRAHAAVGGSTPSSAGEQVERLAVAVRTLSRDPPCDEVGYHGHAPPLLTRVDVREVHLDRRAFPASSSASRIA